MPDDCVFCRIAAGEIPAGIVYQDDAVVAFRDIHPQMPVHVLVVPRRHVGSIDALTDADRDLAGRLLTAVPEVARALGGLENGYRVIANNGADAGQTVHHLHLHVLGGRALGEGMIP
ncbi:MAG TPA: histidine triad nucleotide-binding protein [Longimicrobiaceae bacterium]|nr:histidine triad nucleotide-binding protein [Longimicrobiaceae bacterium]